MSLKLRFIADTTDQAQEAYATLVAAHGDTPLQEADVLIVLGGDGFLLQTLHTHLNQNLDLKVYGLNCGTVGFLLNDFDRTSNLRTQVEAAKEFTLYPLKMTVKDAHGNIHHAHAINEVYLFRSTHESANLEIAVENKTQLERLVCDGVMVATPAGSTAYNFSAHGPILPIESNLLALTPISPFRPRRWRGALIPHEKTVQISVLDANKRPVIAVADSQEVRDAVFVSIHEDRTKPFHLLFDATHSIDAKILNEQFQG